MCVIDICVCSYIYECEYISIYSTAKRKNYFQSRQQMDNDDQRILPYAQMLYVSTYVYIIYVYTYMHIYIYMHIHS